MAFKPPLLNFLRRPGTSNARLPNDQRWSVRCGGTAIRLDVPLTQKFVAYACILSAIDGLLEKPYGSQTHPVEYSYDPQGRMKTMKTCQNFAANSGTATTTWNYDPYRECGGIQGMNRCKKVKIGSSNSEKHS